MKIKLLLIILAAAALAGCDKPVHEVRTLNVPPVLLSLPVVQPGVIAVNA